ncbi:MAG: hypothetical protein R3D05_16235 [Dongiaceae bacterium]
MSSIATRILLGFTAGFLSHLIFQGAFGSILHAAHVLPALPFSLDPVPPFGVPRTLSLGLWAGLWGVAYALLERRLTARFGWWLGGFVFGLAPLAVLWFVVLPLKGMAVGGGFHPATVPIHVGFHEAFGIGVAILFRSGLARARQSGRA